ncbi:hypothetical protein BN137_2915 [Cronobacter condimenti 1330]|uniref:Uncharacterized protein n=1 Tax=Cronobacter condimenti 1330 TaxID=1073999 RepID=K8A1S8_9ENTR|nr:hypothetical protein BN137_2915 [Cronobacter condimenti 1330]
MLMAGTALRARLANPNHERVVRRISEAATLFYHPHLPIFF